MTTISDLFKWEFPMENMSLLYLNSGLTCLPMLGGDNKMTSSSRTKWRLFSASTCKERPLLNYFNATKSFKKNHMNGKIKYEDLPGNLLFFSANLEETSLFPGVLCTAEHNKPGNNSQQNRHTCNCYSFFIKTVR